MHTFNVYVYKQSVHQLNIGHIDFKVTEQQVAFSKVSQRVIPDNDTVLCRAARFCNGAAHGGQVVGPSTVVPGLLQAWGCEKIPDPQIPGTDLQVCLQLTIYSMRQRI